MREQATARILSVWEQPFGSTLAADAEVSDTVLMVDDVSAFNDDGDGGWLLLGEQVVAYTDVDDDAGTITLTLPVETLVGDGEDVYVWSDLYGMVSSQQWALVVVDGKDHNDDPLECVVSDTVSDLVNGDRGRPREACVVERDGDEWVLIRVPGRPSTARGHNWEADDVHTITSDEVTAGSVEWQLSHIPVVESVDARWRTVTQEPTEYTVDYTTGTITWPLAGFEAAGDRLWCHYEYVGELSVPPLEQAVDRVFLGYVEDESGPGHSLTIPVGVGEGSFFVMACAAQLSASSTDPRIDGVVTGGVAMNVYYGRLRTVGGTTWNDPLTATTSGFGNWGAVNAVFYEGGVEVAASQMDTGDYSSSNPCHSYASSEFVVVAALGYDGTVSSSFIHENGSSDYTARGEARQQKAASALFDWASDVPATNPAANFLPSGGTAGQCRIATLQIVNTP